MPPGVLAAMGLGAGAAGAAGAGATSIGTLQAMMGPAALSAGGPATAAGAIAAQQVPGLQFAGPGMVGAPPAAAGGGIMSKLAGVLPTLQGTARTVGDLGVIGNALNPPSPPAMPSQILQGPTQLSKRGGQSSSDELMALLMRVLAERDNAGR